MISVVLASYNGSKFIKEQLDSILNQTYKAFEIICVDDCSSDDTYKILEEYKNKYPDIIKVYKNDKNIGSRATFSKAIEYANGEYVALSDQDDWWYPEKLEILYNNIKNNPNIAFVYSNAHLVDENLSIIKENIIKQNNTLINGKNFLNIIIDNSVMGCTMLLNSNFAKKCLPLPFVGLHHDWYFALMAYNYNLEVKFIDIPLIKYRLHSSNLVNSKKAKGSIITKTKNRIQRLYEEIVNIDFNKIENSLLLDLLLLKKNYILALKNKNFFDALNYWFILFKRLEENGVVNKKIKKQALRYVFYSLLG